LNRELRQQVPQEKWERQELSWPFELHSRDGEEMDGVIRMKTEPISRTGPEITAFTKYYEHDGMLRAYANRAMFLAILFGVISLGSLGFAIYVRIQPPTIIRVDKDGDAMVVGASSGRDPAAKLAGLLSADAAVSAASNSAAPSDLEGRAVLRRFLQHYLSYTPDSVTRNLAESLNMMTVNLRKLTMDKLRDDDTIGKIQQDQIISDFRIRSIERSKDAPWSYVVFGVKEIHRIKNGTEVTDRIVGQYNLRLVEERRTELNPSGLLVADYSEQQMVGDRDNSLLQRSELDR
jgi:type IV secretory pathway TrbF-like protein